MPPYLSLSSLVFYFLLKIAIKICVFAALSQAHKVILRTQVIHALLYDSGQFSVCSGVIAQVCIPAPLPSHPRVCPGCSGGFTNHLPPTYTLDLNANYC